MDIYVVYQQGIYRQGCGGVFSTLDNACEAARKLIALEPDNYHCYEIYKYELNKTSEVEEMDSWIKMRIAEDDPVMVIKKSK